MSRISSQLRAAVIFDMLGPYHVARLSALGEQCQTLGLEISARSNTYGWERVEYEGSFERETLFPMSDSSLIPYPEISRSVGTALARFKPSVVFVPGWASRAALAALGWCLDRGIPAVVMSESTAADHERARWKESLKGQIISCFCAGLVGGDPQRTYLASMGMAADTIVLGYDAVDNAHFARGAARVRAEGSSARARLGLPNHFFLSCARFIPIKNLTGVLEAFAAFCRLCPASKTSLVMLGDGEQRRQLEEVRRTLKLEDRVIFPGFKQYGDLPNYYGLADVFIHMSRIEPWGLVVNEAMAAGLPVVTSVQCGCASTLVQDGKNGYSVQFDAIDKLADRLARLEASVELRARMSADSQEIISAWGPERFAQATCEAADIGLARGPVVPSWTQRAVLGALSRAL